MATRRVKRIKRSKKHVHRARGRKTKRHNRITRRHQGGMFKGIMKALFTKQINPKGGDLYDGIEVFSTKDDMYHIGSRRLDEYKSVDDKQYAEKIIFYLNKASIQLDPSDPTGMVILNQADFEEFAKASQLKDFVPRAAAASVASAAPVAEKPDSKKIFIESTGVQFGTNFKPWGVSNTCEFSDDENPCFTQYVFTKHKNPKLVNVKYVMPMDAKTYCALAEYENVKLLYLTPRFDYGLISPGVTVEFDLQEKGEITSSFMATGIQLNAYYKSCKEPYDDSLYTFYQKQDHNSLVAAMFFDKPDKVEWSDQVYINLITRHIAEGKQNANNPIFPEPQQLIMMNQLDEFERRLNELTALTAKPDSNGLKQLDSEVTDYIRTGFQTSLLQAKKALAAQKLLSVRGPGAAARP
jgi:hypothetical protein